MKSDFPKFGGATLILDIEVMTLFPLRSLARKIRSQHYKAPPLMSFVHHPSLCTQRIAQSLNFETYPSRSERESIYPIDSSGVAERYYL